MPEERSRKRRRVESGAETLPPDSITSSDQLRRLLEFSPSRSAEEVENAIGRFSQFLSDIPADSRKREKAFEILKAYCDQQSPEAPDQNAFADLLSQWHQAGESTVAEALLGAIPSALTQFFRATSTRPEFREFGLSLCQSLLRRDHVRLLDRGLTSPRSKEHLLVIPCLHLLTEIISFDEGVVAGSVFGLRDYLYRRLDGFLEQTRPAESAQRETSARQATLTFLMANLKYLDTTAKTELITHGRTLYLAVRGLTGETREVVVHALETLEKSVLIDETLTKTIKNRCFNSGFLSALARLYDYEDKLEEGETVRDRVHRLLIQVCTTTNGVLISPSSWYPHGYTAEVAPQDNDMIDLGLESPYHVQDDYTDKVPVKNGTLSAFIQTLKPESDLLQSRLVTSIFQAAPELVADYFSKKRKFLGSPSDGEDDPVWRGQFAFLFSVVQLPVPSLSPLAKPPPLSIVIESVIPRPLERAFFMNCLHLNQDIVTMSSTRLLTEVLRKLESVLKIFGMSWRQAAEMLTSMVVQRIAPLSEVIVALQRLKEDSDEPTRTAVLECIATYYEIIPAEATGSKFDIGPVLHMTLLKPSSGLREQVSHLVKIAASSPATKWFHKSDADELSLIGQLLAYCCAYKTPAAVEELLEVVGSVFSRRGILANPRSLDALVYSLESGKSFSPPWQFLDNCLARTMQQPVRYLGRVEQLSQDVSDSKELSLVACCAAEQWAFAVEREPRKRVKHVARWIARLFTGLDVIAGENFRVMLQLRDDMARATADNDAAREVFETAFERQRMKKVLPRAAKDTEEVTTHHSPEVVEGVTDVSHLFVVAPPLPTSFAGLHRWSDMDVEGDVLHGRLARLVRALSSPVAETRLAALHTLPAAVAAVEASSYPEKTQVYLLLGEVLETAVAHHSASPRDALSSVVTELAVSLLQVVATPNSPFYQKTNTFLLRGPRWSITQLLPYWLSQTFLVEPECDDTDLLPGMGSAHALEVCHLLDTLVASLHTAQDVDLLRRGHVFTRLFSYYLSPAASWSTQLKILNVVHNAALCPTGSDTLVTRAGVREWLAVAERWTYNTPQKGDPTTPQILPELVRHVARVVEQNCNAASVARWEADRPVFRQGQTEVK